MATCILERDGSINSRSCRHCGKHQYIILQKYKDIPLDCRNDITYARICDNHRPEKAGPNHCRIIVGGNLIKYPGDMGTKTSDMFTVKLLFNSVILTPGAKFISWTLATSIKIQTSSNEPIEFPQWTDTNPIGSPQ